MISISDRKIVLSIMIYLWIFLVEFQVKLIACIIATIYSCLELFFTAYTSSFQTFNTTWQQWIANILYLPFIYLPFFHTDNSLRGNVYSKYYEINLFDRTTFFITFENVIKNYCKININLNTSVYPLNITLFQFYKFLFFGPILIWTLELIEGYLLIYFYYGKNPSWCYKKHKDGFFSGNIRLFYSPFWICICYLTYMLSPMEILKIY